MTYPERIQDTGYTESVIAPFKLNFYCTRVETKCLVLEYSRMESNIGCAKKGAVFRPTKNFKRGSMD
jgi:hypothetical protein